MTRYSRKEADKKGKSLVKMNFYRGIEAVSELYKDRENIPNMRIIQGRSLPMRHFHAFLEPYPNED